MNPLRVRAAPAIVRRRMRGWFERLTWPVDELEDLLLAVSEAVSAGYR
jgi:anti-sigma regulatory factor (Ser/Thr protein kinase)